MDDVFVNSRDDSLLVSVRLGHGYDDFYHAKAIAVEAKLVEVLEDLFKNEVLHVLCEAVTLKNLSNHMSALIIF